MHTKVQGLSSVQLPQAAPVANLTLDQLKEQTKLTVTTGGKKKIVPVVVRQFQGESESINPFANPFLNQMLRDTSALNPPPLQAPLPAPVIAPPIPVQTIPMQTIPMQTIPI